MAYYVDILSNRAGTVLYTGVTNDLSRRIYEHKQKLLPGFTSKYNATRLVHAETFEDPNSAIAREKQIKAGSRRRKLDLIAQSNPYWLDLYETL